MISITLEKAQQNPGSARAGREEIVIGAPNAVVKLTAVATESVNAGLEPARNSYRGRGVLKGQLHVGPEFLNR